MIVFSRIRMYPTCMKNDIGELDFIPEQNNWLSNGYTRNVDKSTR